MTASNDKTAAVCDASSGKVILWLKPSDGKGVQNHSHHSRTVAEVRWAKLRNAVRGKITSAVYSPDAARILTASGDKTVAVSDSTTGVVLMRLGHHSKEVGDCLWWR